MSAIISQDRNDERRARRATLDLHLGKRHSCQCHESSLRNANSNLLWKVQRKRGKSRDINTGIFPTVSIIADVPQSDRGIGKNFESAAPCSFTKGKVFRQIPRSFVDRMDHRLKKRNRRATVPFVAHRQVEFLRYSRAVPAHEASHRSQP